MTAMTTIRPSAAPTSPERATLSAWRVRAYGGPEALEPVTRGLPTPGPGQVLIRIHASAVSRADTMMRFGTPRWARLFLGLRRPRHDLIGTSLSGVVMAIGPDVRRFDVGDAVFGEAGLDFGANASHICLDEDGVLMRKPDGLSHEEAAVICDGPLTSLNFLREVAQLRDGESVLILGASGSLGSAAVQIARAMGADVTGTTSARNVELVASLGADRVIDYASEDFARSGKRYDVIFDTLGVSSFGGAKRALTENGRYVCPVLGLGLLGAMLRTSLAGSRKARFSATGLLDAPVQRAMLEDVLAMIASGRLAPIIDRTYPLDRLVEAHHYVETGRKRGNVIIV